METAFSRLAGTWLLDAVSCLRMWSAASTSWGNTVGYDKRKKLDDTNNKGRGISGAGGSRVGIRREFLGIDTGNERTRNVYTLLLERDRSARIRILFYQFNNLTMRS